MVPERHRNKIFLLGSFDNEKIDDGSVADPFNVNAITL